MIGRPQGGCSSSVCCSTSQQANPIRSAPAAGRSCAPPCSGTPVPGSPAERRALRRARFPRRLGPCGVGPADQADTRADGCRQPVRWSELLEAPIAFCVRVIAPVGTHTVRPGTRTRQSGTPCGTRQSLPGVVASLAQTGNHSRSGPRVVPLHRGSPRAAHAWLPLEHGAAAVGHSRYWPLDCSPVSRPAPQWRTRAEYEHLVRQADVVRSDLPSSRSRKCR